jgi:diguanylate cyclase (GGDEF)-like protein/PAS domain S-box-containing protein
VLFALGQFLFFAGDLYTYSYPKLFGADVPFPSVGDVIYLSVYPALMAGLIVLVRRRTPHGDRGGVIDALILTTGVALVSWVYLIVPYGNVAGLSLAAKGFSIAYPMGDLLLLGAAIRLSVDAGKRAPAFYLLVGSIVSLLATDSIYTYMLLQNTYTHQLALDAGWVAFYLLWGAAALHPSMRTLDEPAQGRRATLTRRRLALLTVACLLAPFVRILAELHHPDALIVLIGAAVLFLLVLGRMVGLVRDEERSSALRSAGLELVGAASLDQIHEAATKAVRVLIGKGAEVRLVTTGGDARSVLTGRSAKSGSSVPGSATLDWLRSDSTSQPPESVAEELELTASHSLRCLPLSARSRELGTLIVSCGGEFDVTDEDSIAVLAAQVALAVDGALAVGEEHRRQSSARFRSLVANSGDLITVVDQAGVVVYQSPSIEPVLGHAVADFEGTPFERLLQEGDRSRFVRLLTREDNKPGDRHTIECSMLHADGSWRQFELQYTDLLDEQDVRGIVINGRDVSERKQFETQLAHHAFHDPVTNLANRVLFKDRVEHALNRALRDAKTVGLMFIDLDDFKTINDSLGHAAGDVLLKQVAQRLSDTVRPNDTVARFGGDEFAILLEDVQTAQDAADMADRILQALDAPVRIDHTDTYAHASIGICLSQPGASSEASEELLRNADVAMYMAKRNSKGSYRIFEPAMHDRVLERLELRADLQKAMDTGQLEVHYQPLMRLNDGIVYGVEALLRWQHPQRGNVSPAQFIPLAEDTGLIIPIGRWVLNEACRQAVSLHTRFPVQPPLTMSVNLSVKQLQHDRIVEDVHRAISDSGIDPACLVLEITESVLIADAELAIARLHELKSLGVRLAMDDFGTGYSSLSYLSSFPVDILKMDRSFLTSDKVVSGLAAAIVGLGNTLHLDVVAEGIEQPQQITSLRDLGCTLGQGFLFAKAMHPTALDTYLQRHRSATEHGPTAEAA